MYLGYAGKLLRRGWPVILLATLVGVTLGSLLLSNGQSYRSTAHLSMQAPVAQAANRAVQPDRFVRTVGQQLIGEAVVTRAAVALADGTSPGDLREAVAVTGGADNDVLQLTVDGATREQAESRMTAMLASVAKETGLQAAPTLLWTTEPAPKLSRAQLLGGGAVGGAVLGALGVLLWGAYRRPLLAPEYAATGDVGVLTLRGPGRRRSADAVRADARQVLSLVAARHRDSASQAVLLVDLTPSTATKRLTETLRACAVPGLDVCTSPAEVAALLPRPERTTALLLGVAGRTSELDVTRARRQAAGAADDYLALLTSPSWK